MEASQENMKSSLEKLHPFSQKNDYVFPAPKWKADDKVIAASVDPILKHG